MKCKKKRNQRRNPNRRPAACEMGHCGYSRSAHFKHSIRAEGVSGLIVAGAALGTLGSGLALVEGSEA